MEIACLCELSELNEQLQSFSGVGGGELMDGAEFIGATHSFSGCPRRDWPILRQFECFDFSNVFLYLFRS